MTALVNTKRNTRTQKASFACNGQSQERDFLAGLWADCGLFNWTRLTTVTGDLKLTEAELRRRTERWSGEETDWENWQWWKTKIEELNLKNWAFNNSDVRERISNKRELNENRLPPTGSLDYWRQIVILTDFPVWLSWRKTFPKHKRY